MEPITFTRFGWKTLVLFILQKLGIFFATLLLLIALLFGSRFIPAQFGASIASIYPYIFLALALFFAVGCLFGWLEYTHYSMALSDEDIKITTGLITQEETGIPYRRIKEIKIERDVVDELFGLSDVHIIVQGEEDMTPTTAGHVILPHLDKNIALQIQNKVLGKAEVEEMEIEKK